jgi:aspartyl/glutamyl-tRNA(Asn/Gln) amidotransferase C subunit
MTEKIYNPAVSLDELREDIAEPSLPIKEVLAGADEVRDNYFVVPQVVEQ